MVILNMSNLIMAELVRDLIIIAQNRLKFIESYKNLNKSITY